jgi:lysophospholipase L1-like esterase
MGRHRRIAVIATSAMLVAACSREVVLPVQPTVAENTASPETTVAEPTTLAPEPTTTTTSPPPETVAPQPTWVRPSDGGPAVRVMFIGDSLTGGGLPGQALPDDVASYRGTVWAQLQAAGFTNVDFVGGLSWASPPDSTVDPDHEGNGGYSIGPDDSTLREGGPIANVDAYIADWMAAHQPDVVVLMLGLNDMFPTQERDATGKLRDLDPFDAAPKYEALVERIEALRPEVTVFLASYPYIEYLDGVPEWEQLLVTTQGLGGELADDRRIYVPVWETTQDLLAPADYYSDNTHLVASGAAKVGNVVFEALATAWSPAAT